MAEKIWCNRCLLQLGTQNLFLSPVLALQSPYNTMVVGCSPTLSPLRLSVQMQRALLRLHQQLLLVSFHRQTALLQQSRWVVTQVLL